MKKTQKPYKPEILPINMWKTPYPPRWYAQKILELRPELHEIALERVPEGIRKWVKDYLTSAIEIRRTALNQLNAAAKKEDKLGQSNL